VRLLELGDLLSRVHLGPPFDLRVERSVRYPGIDLVLTLQTFDRDTGEPTTVKRVVPVDQPAADRMHDESHVLHWLLSEFTKLARHEIEEQLYLDGCRIFDPHK